MSCSERGTVKAVLCCTKWQLLIKRRFSLKNWLQLYIFSYSIEKDHVRILVYNKVIKFRRWSVPFSHRLGAWSETFGLKRKGKKTFNHSMATGTQFIKDHHSQCKFWNKRHFVALLSAARCFRSSMARFCGLYTKICPSTMYKPRCNTYSTTLCYVTPARLKHRRPIC